MQEGLLTITGSIDCNRRETKGYSGFDRSLQSARQHQLEHEVLTGDEVNARFPGYNLPSDFVVSQPFVPPLSHHNNCCPSCLLHVCM